MNHADQPEAADRTITLVSGVTVTITITGEEVVIGGANGELARFSLQECTQAEWWAMKHGLNHWGRWAFEQRQRLHSAKWKALRSPTEWQVWASNKVSSFKRREFSASRTKQRLNAARGMVQKPMKANTWQTWIRGMMARLSYVSKRAMRTPWQIWSETKLRNLRARHLESSQS